VLVDKGVLGGHWEKVFLLILTVLGLVGGNVGEDVKANNWGRGDRSTSDDISGAVRDVEEGVILWVVKDRPGKFGGWGTWDNGLENMGGDVERTWVVPSVVRALEDLKDGSCSVRNVLLIDVVKGRPGSNGDMGEGGKAMTVGLEEVNDTQYSISSTIETVLMSRPTTV